MTLRCRPKDRDLVDPIQSRCYDASMTATEIIEEIRSKARELSKPERAQLARELVLVSEELDDDAVASGAIADIDAGRFVDGDVAFERVKAMLLKMK